MLCISTSGVHIIIVIVYNSKIIMMYIVITGDSKKYSYIDRDTMIFVITTDFPHQKRKLKTNIKKRDKWLY